MNAHPLDEVKFALSVRINSNEYTHVNSSKFDITIEDTFFVIIKKKGTDEVLAETTVFNAPYFRRTKTTHMTAKKTIKTDKSQTLS